MSCVVGQREFITVSKSRMRRLTGAGSHGRSGSVRISSLYHSVGDPFVRRARERDIHTAVGAVLLRRRHVGLHDDLDIRIHALDAAHEGDVLLHVAVRIGRIAEDQRVLGHDAELAQTARQVHRLLRGELLLHIAQHLVGAGLHAEEDHDAPGGAQLAQRVVRVAEHDVDARLAPPAQVQRRHAIGQLARVIFAQEEVVVVELHRVDAVVACR